MWKLESERPAASQWFINIWVGMLTTNFVLWLGVPIISRHLLVAQGLLTGKPRQQECKGRQPQAYRWQRPLTLSYHWLPSSKLQTWSFPWGSNMSLLISPSVSLRAPSFHSFLSFSNSCHWHAFLLSRYGLSTIPYLFFFLNLLLERLCSHLWIQLLLSPGGQMAQGVHCGSNSLSTSTSSEQVTR